MRRPKSRALLLINLAGLALAVACSGSLGSPVGPTASDAFIASSGGTTIRGRASTGASTSSARTTASSSTSIKVCVTGTNNCDTIDAGGQFELKGDFSGNVDLTFTSPLGTSSATIPNVVAGETIVVAVSIAGGSATVKIESRTNGSGDDDSADDDSADDVSDDVSDDESVDDEAEDDDSEDDDSEDDNSGRKSGPGNRGRG